MLNSRFVQILPCEHPLIAVYGNGKRIESIENIEYLGLNEEGDVVELTFADGYAEPAENAGNYIGTFTADAIGIKQMLSMLGYPCWE